MAAFDSLRSTKGYIQMKGRARKKDAKFFVFRNVEDKESTKSSLNLESAQDIERRVSQFIASRSHIRSLPTPKVEMREAKPMADVDNEELLAVDMGVYMSGASTVDLNSAKSLVNRYVLSLPIDPIARTTKELVSFTYHRFIIVQYVN